MKTIAPHFYYRIDTKKETTYKQIILEGGHCLSHETYGFIHQNMRYTLANELRIPPQFIHCISASDYQQATHIPFEA